MDKICSCCKISKPFTTEFYYLNGRHTAKCRKCKNVKIGDRNTVTFMENIDDTWKNHPAHPEFYFERDTNRLFNTLTGKYIDNIRSFNNKTKKSPKDIKWIIFNGPILENQVVKTKIDHDINDISLDTLECVYINCESCNKLVENPNILSRYCSFRCQADVKNGKAVLKRENDIEKYIAEKHHVQKNINKKKFNIEIDYNIDYLVSLGTNCFYCDTTCSFGNKEYQPDTLTFDRKDSNEAYIKENIVVCCWFCNTSKNISSYFDWMQYINFIKNPKILELDLTSKDFSKNSRNIDCSGVYGSLKKESPSYYPNSKSAKETFIKLSKKQNYKDSIFNFFPIIYLEQNCLWNASIDAIDSSLPDEDKHRPDNLQIIPKCFNYAKQLLTQEQFLKEWTKRGFKTDFSKCNVKLPNNYSTECYFNKTIQ